MKRALLIILTFAAFHSESLQAQWNFLQTRTQADSVRRVIATAKHDSTRIGALCDLGVYWNYTLGKPDSALVYVREAEKLAQTSNLSTALVGARVYHVLGTILLNQTKVKDAEEYYAKARKIYEERDYKRGLGFLTNSTGAVFYTQNKLPVAAEQYEKALATAKKIGNETLEAFAMTNLGNIDVRQKKDGDAKAKWTAAKALFERTGNRKGAADITLSLATLLVRQENFPEARKMFRSAAQIFLDVGHIPNAVNALSNIGIMYDQQGRFEEALTAYFQGLQLAENNGLKQQTGDFLLNLTVAHTRMKKYSEAEEYGKRTVQIAQELKNPAMLARASNNLGTVFVELKEYDKALPIYNTALEIIDKSNSAVAYNLSASLYNNIANIYDLQGQYDKAIPIFQKALTLNQANKNTFNLSQSFYNIGYVYTKKRQFDSAMSYIRRGLDLANSINSRIRQRTALEYLSVLYDSLGEHKLALQTYRQMRTMQDSMMNEESLKKSAQLKEQYESDKKDREITLLQKDKDLQTLTLAKQQTDLEKQEANLARERAESERRRQSLLLIENERQLQNLTLEQQEAQLTETRLTSERDKQALALAEKDASLKDATLRERNTEISRQRVIQWALAAILLGAIVTAAWLGRLYQQKRSSNREIRRQQDILQDQATEIELVNTQLHETNIGLDTALHDLKATQSQLVQSERMSAVGMLTAGVMHEINNPNAIAYSAITQTRAKLAEMTEYFLSMLDDESKDSAEVRKFQEMSNDALSRLELAADGSQRVKTIVANLQGFSKHQENDVLAGDWAKEIRGTVSLFQLQYQAVSVETSIPATLRMHANFGELNQVLLNMLVNATQAGATALRITAEETATQATVSIADNGKGIPPEVQAHIFEPFFSTKGVGNSGLGLSISKQIVERHGGTLRCESVVGGGVPVGLSTGTTFIIELPKEAV